MIYLDDAATTAVRPGVLKAMTPYFSTRFGNPSSPHALGEVDKEVIEARKKLAHVIGAKPHEIVFTSGASESDSWAIQRVSEGTIAISEIEHAAIMESCRNANKVVRIKVNEEGFVDLLELENLLKKGQVSLVSVIHGNNVIGTLQDIASIGKLCRKYRVLFHTDAAQTFTKVKIDVNSMHIDLLSASAHKIGGPKGIGLLYIRDGVKIAPLIFGGGQERGLRGGTENVPGIIGFAKAAELSLMTDWKKVENSREALMKKLEKIGGRINGSRIYRIPGNIHASFPFDARVVVQYLSKKKIYVSTGSACESKREKEDHVLRAIGLDEKLSKGSLRISFNRILDDAEISLVVREIAKAMKTFAV